MTEYQNPFADRKHYHEHSEWISEHISKFYDDSIVSVFHEIPALDLRLDIYFIKPENSEFNILLTSGMSTLKMNVSSEVENVKDLEFAELMILVPKSIEFNEIYTGENNSDWIISILKRSAKFPHFYDTWIGVGHSLQAEEDFSPYSTDTNFVGALILPSVTFDKNFTEINRKGRKINFYDVFPLYKNELEFKIENGYSKTLDLIIEANPDEVLDINRENFIPKKSFWSRVFKN